MKKLIITFCLALPLSVFLYAQAPVIVPSAYEPKPFTVAEGKQVTFSCGNLQ